MKRRFGVVPALMLLALLFIRMEGLAAGTCPICGSEKYELVRIVRPTCMNGGYSLYQCGGRCDLRRGDLTKRDGHVYGVFTPNGNGTHSSDCWRRGCDRTGTMDCLLLKHTAEDGIVTACPICGETDAGVTLTLMEGAEIQSVSGDLPKGNRILRFGALADDVGLMSVAVEFIGRPQPLKGAVRFSLPAESFPENSELLFVSAQGEETEIPLTIEGGMLRFTADLTPMGSESPVLAALLRVVVPEEN